MRSRHVLRATLALTLFLLLPGLALLSAPRPPARSWVRQELPLEPTWPDQPRYNRDAAFEPVVSGDAVLITSSRLDRLTAVSRRTGETLWRFTAGGPIRTTPAAWNGRVYVASDDGHLYCLRQSDGSVEWKFRGGPAGRNVLGNERLISTWPARGGPVVVPEGGDEATVYFAAGIWPFMGIFLHALDAAAGEVRWSNSGEGAIFIKQPHQTDAFAGIAPQGSLVVEGDSLIVPGGRSIPACYDRHTGRRIHYRLAESSKRGGGPHVSAGCGVYVNGGGGFDLATGEYLGPVKEPATIADGRLYTVSGRTLRVYDLMNRLAVAQSKDKKDKKDKKAKPPAEEEWLGPPLFTVRVPAAATTVLIAGQGKVHGAGAGMAYTLAAVPGGFAVQRQAAVSGTPLHLAAADDQLLVSTREGVLYALGSGNGRPQAVPAERTRALQSEPELARRTQEALAAAGVRAGYAVVWGAGSGGMVAELLRHPGLRLVVVEPDEGRAARFRERLHAAGVDGKRATVLHGTPTTAGLPPYLAAVTFCEDLDGSGLFSEEEGFEDLNRLFESLRPYGGVACLPVPQARRARLKEWLATRPGEGQVRLEERGEWVLIRRPGALPGAGDWTHQHANPANTRVSRDRRVKAPLGLLWFGGPGNQAILPRHGHGPVPQVCEGRLFIEGPNALRAADVYTGRLLWERQLPGLGKPYDNVSHQPGANALGSNYVSRPEGVYVAYRDACLRLDPASGKTLSEYRLPPLPGQKKAPEWTFLTVAGDHLIGGTGGVGLTLGTLSQKIPIPTLSKGGRPASQRLTILSRQTGKVVAHVQARDSFRHNAICVGNGRLYAIDRDNSSFLARKKDAPAVRARLVCHDVASGKRLWASEKEVFGTWLSYSEEHDVLVEAGLMSRDTLADEPAGMRAYEGSSGRTAWYRKDYFGPALIRGERVLKGGDARGGSGTACELRTGKPIKIPDPLTGEPTEWRWTRTYGCNTPAASEHLMLFRSGAAGFYDLCNDGGTGNLGGFRSSCTLNLIAAGGVLTVPDYTRTCTCSYQNQCSVGLVHTPDADLWTFTTSRQPKGALRRVGINLGAPGSRKSDGGTLWLEYPPAGGPSPRLAVTADPPRPATFRLHTTQVEGEGLRWVAASGLRDLRELTVAAGTGGKKPMRYTVRTYFLEPDGLPPGRRVFDVALQGKQVEAGLDVSKEAGGPGRVLVREYTGVEVNGRLRISLTPSEGAGQALPVLSGVELVAQDAE